MCWENKFCHIINQLNQLLCAASSAVTPTIELIPDMEPIDYVVVVVLVIAAIVVLAVVGLIVFTFIYWRRKRRKICLNGT